MKKVLTMLLALMMVLSSVSVFAADKTPVQAATQVYVPADLQVSGDASNFVDRLAVQTGNQIAVRASLDMSPVRNAFLEDYNSIVDADGDGVSDPTLESALKTNTSVSGAWTLTLQYPNVLTIPDAVVNGTGMDGFSDNAKLIFEEDGARILDETNHTLTIKVKVKDGITVGYLKENLESALGNMTFTATDVDVTNAQNCQLIGTISGTTRIESTSHYVEYKFDGYDSDTNNTNDTTVEAELYVVSTGNDSGVDSSWSSGNKVSTGVVADPKVTGVADILNVEDHILYMEGYPDGTIRPEANVTRAEATTMLYRLLRPEIRDNIFTLDNNFGDVDSSLWYNKAVSSMAKGGYVNGYEDGNFYGDNSITRAELVTIVARFAKAEEAEVPFTDVDASHWAYGYISTAVANGWIGGYEDGSFKPEQNITRAEAAAVINRVLSRGVKSAGVVDSIKVWPDNPKSEWYYYELIEATNDHTYSNTRPNEFWKTLHIDYEYDIVHYERP